MNADDLAYHLTLTRMWNSGRYTVDLKYSDGSMITVHAMQDESNHFLNGSLGNLMPMNVPRIWPFGIIAIWHEVEA